MSPPGRKWEQVSAAVTAYVAHGHRLERLGFAADHRPHSSSASRFTAGASGFLLLIQSGDRPDLYRESFRDAFEAKLAGMMEDIR
jgi:hypothetical protein